MADSDPRLDDLAREVQRLRDWRHDAEPTIRALVLRDEHRNAALEQVAASVATLTDQVKAMVEQDKIAQAVADEVEKRAKVTAEALAERDRKWHERISLPYRMLIGAAAGAAALVVIVNAVTNLIVRFAG